MQEENFEQNENPAEGPILYRNWKLAERSAPLLRTSEYPLFSDSHVVGEWCEENLPFDLLNGLSFSGERQLGPAVILRQEVYISFRDIFNDKNPDNNRFYHGGGMIDEFASLLSLLMGIRFRAGGATRVFEVNGDPKGSPCFLEEHRNPVLLENRSARGLVLPRVEGIGKHNLEKAQLLRDFPLLAPKDSFALVCSARLYQDALWIVESAPELAWLMLVSAIETAANHWKQTNEPNLERLQNSRPELHELLVSVGGDSLAAQVADQIAPQLGATNKFIKFILEFLPEAPDARPSEAFQFKWSRGSIRKTMNRVYGLRSSALHAGTPFPKPMCDSPLFDHHSGTHSEKPGGISSGFGLHKWDADETPIHFHTFEYIARNVLLKWWDSMFTR